MISHAPAAPYPLVNNEASLLDASDLVFVDAPGTGFGRITGKDKEKAFYGVDADAHAFAEFITGFLSKYGRWNSPKYLFGESYGTTRSAVLANLLETDRSVDFNGVILLSQILAFDASGNQPQDNPGIDLPYVVSLPTYAATAWYHHKLPDAPKDLPAFLDEVEHFATHDYALALGDGAALDPAERKTIVAKLHQYTGLPPDYIEKADLPGTTTGRLDTRFSGPSMDPLSKESDYDPQSRRDQFGLCLRLQRLCPQGSEIRRGQDLQSPEIELWRKWDYRHQPPGEHAPLAQSANVMPRSGQRAENTTPTSRIMLNAGYFDLATPFYEGIYEMRQSADPGQAAGQYRVQILRIGPHGLCP
ncbi:MAG: hypothetical protein WDN69_14840 [Aliidongia sp.]